MQVIAIKLRYFKLFLALKSYYRAQFLFVHIVTCTFPIISVNNALS